MKILFIALSSKHLSYIITGEETIKEMINMTRPIPINIEKVKNNLDYLFKHL